MIVGVNLPFENNKLPTFNIFLEKIDSIVGHVLSVPWLVKHLAENPTTKIEIRFVTDRSFSEKAQESFVESMIEGKAEDLLAPIKASLANSVFLEISENGRWTRWLVLPDRRMVLWHYKTESVLGWDLSKAKSWERYGWNETRFELADGVLDPCRSYSNFFFAFTTKLSKYFSRFSFAPRSPATTFSPHSTYSVFLCKRPIRQADFAQYP